MLAFPCSSPSLPDLSRREGEQQLLLSTSSPNCSTIWLLPRAECSTHENSFALQQPSGSIVRSRHAGSSWVAAAGPKARLGEALLKQLPQLPAHSLDWGSSVRGMSEEVCSGVQLPTGQVVEQLLFSTPLPDWDHPGLGKVWRGDSCKLSTCTAPSPGNKSGGGSFSELSTARNE